MPDEIENTEDRSEEHYRLLAGLEDPLTEKIDRLRELGTAGMEYRHETVFFTQKKEPHRWDIFNQTTACYHPIASHKVVIDHILLNPAVVVYDIHSTTGYGLFIEEWNLLIQLTTQDATNLFRESLFNLKAPTTWLYEQFTRATLALEQLDKLIERTERLTTT